MKEHLSKLFGFGNDNDKEFIKDIDINTIYPNPYQPRKTFTQANLEELAQSIKEYGIIQPIVVRKVGNNYELVAGERRFRASQLAGLNKIPAIIKDLTDKEIAEIALIENLQRENLSFFEEAEGYAKLIQEFGITQEELAKKFGKSQSTIANKIRLLNLSPLVRENIRLDIITERHARALLKIKEEDLQLKILNIIYEEGLNVRQTDQLIEELLTKEDTEEKEDKVQVNRKVKRIYKDMRIFLNTIRGAVQTIQEAGLPADIKENELDDYYEVTIKLPKNS